MASNDRLGALRNAHAIFDNFAAIFGKFMKEKYVSTDTGVTTKLLLRDLLTLALSTDPVVVEPRSDNVAEPVRVQTNSVHFLARILTAYTAEFPDSNDLIALDDPDVLKLFKPAFEKYDNTFTIVLMKAISKACYVSESMRQALLDADLVEKVANVCASRIVIARQFSFSSHDTKDAEDEVPESNDVRVRKLVTEKYDFRNFSILVTTAVDIMARLTFQPTGRSPKSIIIENTLNSLRDETTASYTGGSNVARKIAFSLVPSVLNVFKELAPHFKNVALFGAALRALANLVFNNEDCQIRVATEFGSSLKTIFNVLAEQVRNYDHSEGGSRWTPTELATAAVDIVGNMCFTNFKARIILFERDSQLQDIIGILVKFSMDENGQLAEHAMLALRSVCWAYEPTLGPLSGHVDYLSESYRNLSAENMQAGLCLCASVATQLPLKLQYVDDSNLQLELDKYLDGSTPIVFLAVLHKKRRAFGIAWFSWLAKCLSLQQNREPSNEMFESVVFYILRQLAQHGVPFNLVQFAYLLFPNLYASDHSRTHWLDAQLKALQLEAPSDSTAKEKARTIELSALKLAKAQIVSFCERNGVLGQITLRTSDEQDGPVDIHFDGDLDAETRKMLRSLFPYLTLDSNVGSLKPSVGTAADLRNEGNEAPSASEEAASNDLSSETSSDEDPVFTFDEDVDERINLPTYNALVESGRIVGTSIRQPASNSEQLPPRRDEDVKVVELYERICDQLAPSERPQITEFSSVRGVGLRIVNDALRINITLYAEDSNLRAQQGSITELFSSDHIDFSYTEHDFIASRSDSQTTQPLNRTPSLPTLRMGSQVYSRTETGFAKGRSCVSNVWSRRCHF